MKALFKAGFANQPTSERRHDGLTLKRAYITAMIHCAPPQNKPKTIELNRCRPFLIKEIKSLKKVKAVLALGLVAFNGYLKTLNEINLLSKGTSYKFSHGLSYDLGPSLPRLFASYHPSRQNTQTGRLTEKMFNHVFKNIKNFLDEG